MEKQMDTSLLDRAIRFAVAAHAGVERRGKGFPYIVHPMEAMAIAATMTADQEILAAAALHDVVEDTEVTLDDLRAQFGDRVARLVDTESDHFEDGLDWRSRKEDSLRRLKEATRDEKIASGSRRNPSTVGGTTPCWTPSRTFPIPMRTRNSTSW